MHLEIRAVYRMKFYPGKWDAVNSRGLPDSTVNSPHEYILGWNYPFLLFVCVWFLLSGMPRAIVLHFLGKKRQFGWLILLKSVWGGGTKAESR